jgi:hypothetical protein
MENTDTVPETVPEDTEPAPEQSPFLFSVASLLSEYELISQKEASDKAVVDAIEFPNVDEMRAKLIDWARRGFPDISPLFSITINPPLKCSDGVSRTLFDYIQYICGEGIEAKMNRLAEKLDGMRITCSYSGNRITFHVTKTA